jgi:peptidyl-prolyl cis-trans isomerase SurA
MFPAFGQEEVVMIVDGDSVQLSEFLYIFNKNREDKPIDEKEIREYMDLFLNFKLKVAEAERLGLDTVPSFERELESYRKQLARPYLIDKEIKESLIDEVFERLKWEVRASHILIMVDENASPEDTLKAYDKVHAIKKELDEGGNFEELAKRYSDDPSVANNSGDIGYFSALYLVYPFESAAYETKVGEISAPVKTQFGYHLIKVTDKRPAQGERLASHIMIKVGEDATEEDKLNAEKKINEIYDRAIDGADFEQLARQFSDDVASAQKGGELPWFGTNKMVQSFEEATFALDSIGQISEPVFTPYGWHIIKLLGIKGPPNREDNEYDIRQRIERDSRSNLSQKAVIERLKKEYGYKTYPNRIKDFEKVVDETFYTYKWTADKASDLKKTMFILDGLEYTQPQFAEYLVEAMKKGRHNRDISIMLKAVYEAWVDESILAYEESKLEEKYLEFRMLYQEYRDGILLFELMRERVWDKPLKDSLGLDTYYRENISDYYWPERVEAEVWSCETEKIAKRVAKYLNASKTSDWILDKVNVQSELSAQMSTGLFLRGINAAVDSTQWKTGVHAPISWDGRYYAVRVVEVRQPEAKTLEECRGLVVTDYQAYLEEALITELRERFEWKIFPEVLNNIQ